MMSPVQLTSAEQQAFDEMLQTLPVEDTNCFPGSVIGPFLMKFELPQKTLAKIWDFCDEEDKGYLTRNQAYVCLRFVAQAQKGVPLRELDVTKAGTPPSFPHADQLTGLPTSNHTTDFSPFRQPVDPQLRLESEIEFRNQLDNFEDKENPNLMPSSIAKPLFLQSGLSTTVLAQIWNLADSGHVGYLNVEQYVIAKHLVMLCKKYNLVHLPRSLPSYVVDSAKSDALSSSVNTEPFHENDAVPVSDKEPNNGNFDSSVFLDSAQTETKPHSLDFVAKSINPEDRENFSKLFNKIDNENKGFITGDEAVPFFMASKLDPDELAKVWEIADKDEKGFIVKTEFLIAMQIIKLRLTGQSLDSIISSGTEEQITFPSKDEALSNASPLANNHPIYSGTAEDSSVLKDEKEHLSKFPGEPVEHSRFSSTATNQPGNDVSLPTLDQTIENLVPGGDETFYEPESTRDVTQANKPALENDFNESGFHPSHPSHLNWTTEHRTDLPTTSATFENKVDEPNSNLAKELQTDQSSPSEAFPHQEHESFMNLPSANTVQPEEALTNEEPKEAAIDPAEIDDLQQQISSSKFSLDTIQQSHERIASDVNQQKLHLQCLRDELTEISRLKETTQQSISRNLMTNQQLSAQVGSLTMDKRELIKELKHLRTKIDEVLADAPSSNVTSGVNSPVLLPESTRSRRAQPPLPPHSAPKSSTRSSLSSPVQTNLSANVPPYQAAESQSSHRDPQTTSSGTPGGDRKSEILQELLSMGFPKDKSLIALTAVNYDANEAINILLSSQ
ncbi:UBA/EH/EF hand domain-containing protein Ucp8 [Schizosaccharomyces octosporus yFS286]|uniref:UBA/EH/EF hand domain-containing protein Ucp8 n=1 Tax=Schizosaccharomyces octosporus (strain yFS286) TaxID=483514 RepID=S9PSY9_SCHOY|nr:UBA/EH/EF hand domain-containing protein Ucp8 [Schizosaccharomyces octosporus yFS286]EPX72271.1 UBA/EH/EF hand domain-containing protein Ucp8 [Schizosaccharomyces octosporus yFS286]